MKHTNNMYTCERCGYQTQRKNILKSHLERKFTCKPIQSNIDVTELLTQFSKPYCCKYCSKGFVHNSSKYRHEKTCKVSQMIQSENVTNNNITNNITNNNCNNTINLNITLNAYNQSNVDFLLNSTEKMKNILNSSGVIQNLLKEINFNKEHPENHNLSITNLRSNRAEVYDGNSFIVKDKMEVIHTKMIELIDIVKQSQDVDIAPERLQRMLKVFEDLETHIKKKGSQKSNLNYNKLYKETEDICYNNRDIIRHTKKNIQTN